MEPETYEVVLFGPSGQRTYARYTGVAKPEAAGTLRIGPLAGMSWLVQPRLVNDPFSDPGVYLDFRYGRRAILFDLGDVSPLSSRELLRVSHVFVSHTHVDHMAGFDRLFRLCLHRPSPLTLIGPPGFAEQVEHRIRSFTWNLLDENSVDFRLRAMDYDGYRPDAGCRVPCPRGVRPARRRAAGISGRRRLDGGRVQDRGRRPGPRHPLPRLRPAGGAAGECLAGRACRDGSRLPARG